MTVTLIKMGEKEMEKFRAETDLIEDILRQHGPQTATILLTIVCAETFLNIMTADDTPALQLFEEFAMGVRQSIASAIPSQLH